MKIVFRLFAVLMCCGCAAHGEELREVSAGLIAYACKDGGAVYLLAYDPNPNREGWGAFGGFPKRGERAAATARREFHEETNCAYDMRLLNAAELKGPSKVGGFYSFVAKVPFVEIDVIQRARACQDVERSNWVWLDHAELLAALQGSGTKPPVRRQAEPDEPIHLWAGAAESLRQALWDGYLAKADPCRN